MSNTFVHKPWKVAAIQWTGDNFVEVKQFIYDWIGDQDATGPRADPDDEFRTLQFYAWGDDQEVDPHRWIVVHQGLDDGEIMYTDQFQAAYEPGS